MEETPLSYSEAEPRSRQLFLALTCCLPARLLICHFTMTYEPSMWASHHCKV